MAKKIDPAKAKAKRDKIVAGVLGGVLLVVAVFAVPMTLKQWKKLSGGNIEQTAATSPPPPGPASLAPPTVGSPGGIASTASAPVSTGELRAFNLFASKDPFEQQVDVAGGGEPPSSSPPPSAPAPGVVPPGSPGGTTPPAAEPLPSGAVISINGAPAELVGVGTDFPLPPAVSLFHVVSLSKGKAKISIVGGSYADGSPAVTLSVGKPLTLENTADGTRYELRLLWVGTGAPPPGLVPAPPTAIPTAPPSTPTSTP